MIFKHKREKYQSEEKKEYPILPENIYDAEISDVKASDDESYFKIYFKIINNETYNGQMVFSLPIYKNHIDPIKLQKSLNRLNGILEAINMDEINDTMDLIDKQLKIKVIITKGKGEYAGTQSNMVVNYYPINDANILNKSPGSPEIKYEDVPF